MAFTTNSVGNPVVNALTIVGPVSFRFGKVNFSADIDTGNWTATARVGIIDAKGFRMEKAKAAGTDLVTCAVNLAAVVASFS